MLFCFLYSIDISPPYLPSQLPLSLPPPIPSSLVYLPFNSHFFALPTINLTSVPLNGSTFFPPSFSLILSLPHLPSFPSNGSTFPPPPSLPPSPPVQRLVGRNKLIKKWPSWGPSRHLGPSLGLSPKQIGGAAPPP
ncbi:hypothetical protein E2C01_102099 [Portunus trituberculatus]|uniref:Uncharacterized protein n=1 Tax=Portunus trituberculatus TaxID=210409 RepID=A0A5B7KHH0_PORTR|nr:hypothetical protein [Portunus trituberculatus]